MQTGPGTDVVVGPARAELALFWVGFPLVGAGLGWLVLQGSAWVASLPVAPVRRAFAYVASLPDPQATLVALGLGVIAGLALAAVAVHESLTVTVAGDAVTLDREGASRAVARSAVAGVFVDRNELVLLDRSSAELAREPVDLDARRLADAFRAHGYPWIPGGDPHAAEFRRWLDGAADLPAGANAVLRTRQRALDAGDAPGVLDGRDALAALGVVVRDEKKRQFWRPTRR